MGQAIAVVVGLAGGGLAWWLLSVWTRHERGRRNSRLALLAELAATHGIELRWDEAELRYSGTTKGHPTDYRLVVTGYVEGMPSYKTRVSVRVPVGAMEMDVRPSGILGLGDGERGIRTGDPDFDRAYVVETTSDERARMLLDVETRHWLMIQRPAYLRVATDGVVFEASGRVDDEVSVRTILLNLAHLADRIAEPDGYRT